MKNTMKLAQPLVTTGGLLTFNISGAPAGFTITEITLSDGKDDPPEPPTVAEISKTIASIKKAHGGHMDIPMPGESFFADNTVIASTWLRDEDPVTCLVMFLNHGGPPFYSVAELIWNSSTESWDMVWMREFPNINPATEAYADSGGDY